MNCKMLTCETIERWMPGHGGPGLVRRGVPGGPGHVRGGHEGGPVGGLAVFRLLRG